MKLVSDCRAVAEIMVSIQTLSDILAFCPILTPKSLGQTAIEAKWPL